MAVLCMLGFLVCLVDGYDLSGYSKSSQVTSWYKLHWNMPTDMISIVIEADTTGWVGFGLAEAGGMAGADIVTASVDDTTGVASVTDRFSLGEAYPSPDTCQDWEVINGAQENGKTFIEIRRKLATNDTQDMPILNNGIQTRILVAMSAGGSDSFGYHGDTNRLYTSLNFFASDVNADPLAFIKTDPDVQYFDVLNNYTIPPENTKYHKTCHNLTEAAAVNNDIYIIGMEHIITPASKEYVHHLIVGSTSKQREGNDYHKACATPLTHFRKKRGFGHGPLVCLGPRSLMALASLLVAEPADGPPYSWKLTTTTQA